MTVAAHRFDNAKRRRPDDHPRHAMLTPAYVLEPIRAALWNIELDPCTEPDNPTGARRFYCLPTDGCVQPWFGPVFCNPPYGEAKDRWVRRCIAAGRLFPVALLLPAHTETRIAQEALAASDSVVFIRGRLRFGVLRENRRQEAASHGSMLLMFGDHDIEPLRGLGVVMRREVPS